MNADEILANTFASHEQLAPDAERTRALIDQQLQRPGSGSLRATLSTAAAVLLLMAGVIGTVVGISKPFGHSAAAPKPVTPAESIAELDQLSIADGWLPPATSEEDFSINGFGVQSRYYQNYLGDYGTSTDVIQGILIRLSPGESLPTTVTPADLLIVDPPETVTMRSFKQSEGRDLSIAGQAAREWSGERTLDSRPVGFSKALPAAEVTHWYHLAVSRPGGLVASVTIEQDQSPISAAERQQLGRQVAAHLRYDRTDPIRRNFGLDYVPDGLVVRSIGYTNGSGTTYKLGRPGSPTPSLTVSNGMIASVVTFPTEATVENVRTAAGRPVAGHSSYVARYPDSRLQLCVPGLLTPARALTVTSMKATGADAVSLAELYHIADGVRYLTDVPLRKF
jgi:hypothetical protein